MADNRKTAEKDTEASQAAQEQQVSHMLHDSPTDSFTTEVTMKHWIF